MVFTKNEVEKKGPKRHYKEWSFLLPTLPGFDAPEVSPGVKLNREGVTALHPVVLVPGIVTGGLELWEGRSCAEGLFRKRLWGGSFAHILQRPLCWLEHLSLHNETGLDPPGIRVRAVPGLVAADNFASDYLVWAVLIENLARIGYEGKNLYMAAYDWRLSFQNTESRDQALSRLKSNIELMFVTNGYKKVVVVPQSMGAIYFLHFLKWVETPPPMGGGGGPGWCDKHIKAIMNISPAFLGIPKAVSNIFSAEGSDIAFVRAVASGILNFDYLGLQTVEHVLQVCRTWDSIISLMPKGGKTIWGDLDWCTKEWSNCDQVKKGYVKHFASDNTYNFSDMQKGLHVKEPIKNGRIISFGKAVSQLLASLLTALDSEEISWKSNSATSNLSCEDVWTECDEMSREIIWKVAKEKACTARTVFDLLNFVAPKVMKRAEAHFSHGIAENLEDPKYAHYKYWSNPLETKLPNAPHMEIYCLYGVGIPTERSYVHKLSPSDKLNRTPFQLDSSADGEGGSWLQNGVYFVEGDESVPVVSSGFMCAKGWRGRTRFNPSGMAAYVREYQHKQPGSILKGRGLESGARVNIMGNVSLIEDVLRVAAGATGADIGGDRIFSDIMRMSERINLRL
ncbi:Lecithin:cholesterol/phospholipid:diacylglycerol acyltransferase [Sesbania bispinosa]|nr:Lecithin:cholesterol/phospholipid:diacylglycerol acyltransferase [Sesbania bispinosa]